MEHEGRAPEHSDLIDKLVQVLEESSDYKGLLGRFAAAIRLFPISWAQCQETLHVFKEHCRGDNACFVGIPEHIVHGVVDQLPDSQFWPFRQATGRPARGEHYTIWCERMSMFAFAGTHPVWQSHSVPAPVGKERVVLHAFAGRRRFVDFQWYLEDMVQHTEGIYRIHVISIDIVIDLHYGDLGNREVQEFWLEGIRRRWVHSFLGGPPCCTWSRARSVALQTRHGSHPVRSADCGVSHHLHCVSWSLMARSCLASACLRSVNSLQGRAGVLEQPAEPEQSSAPSIWKLPAV